MSTDFHEIDAQLNSDIPLEIKHQINNVLSLIKEAIEKLKISLILPKILENPKVLHQYVKSTKYHNCLKLVQEYRNEGQAESPQELCQNEQLIQIIDYFQENYKILDVLPNWLDDIDNTEKCLLTAFEDVYHVAQERFLRPAMADLANEKRLHEIYLANEKAKRDIKDTAHRIETHKIDQLWKVGANNAIIKKLEDELSYIKYDNNVFVQRKMLTSHREINHINIVFTSKQQELEEELKKSRFNYESKLDQDLKKERNICDERNKLQLQLQALIKKYDQTIYDKYVEEMLLQAEYEKEKQEFDNILMVYNKEDAIHEELVRKKERHLKMLHDTKIVLFIYFRAARKIQRWWKGIQAKAKKDKAQPVKGKKTGKSGSKGKKK